MRYTTLRLLRMVATGGRTLSRAKLPFWPTNIRAIF